MAQKVLLSILFMGLCAWPTSAQMPTAPYKSSRTTTFLAHFDGPSLRADLAKGKPKGRGKPTFVEGRFGKALSLVGPIVKFSAPRNVNMRRGTIELWLLNLDWNDKHRRTQRNVLRLRGGRGGKAWYMQVLVIGRIIYFRIYMYGDPKTKKGFAYSPLPQPRSEF